MFSRTRRRVLVVAAALLLLVGCNDDATSDSAQDSSSVPAPPPAPSWALVLGDGGVTGNAWEIGMLKGLHDAGLDMNLADMVIGTSAGGLVGSRLRAGQSLDAMYDEQANPTPADLAEFEELGDYVTSSDLAAWTAIQEHWAAPPDEAADSTTKDCLGLTGEEARSCKKGSAEFRAEIGALALAANTPPEEAWIDLIADYTGVTEWPSRPIRFIATNVQDGSLGILDETGGPIDRALAATTALTGLVAPITFGPARYMDGATYPLQLNGIDDGYVTVVLILSHTFPNVDEEIEALRARGVNVVAITPDAASKEALGENDFDLEPSRRAESATAGLRQAADEVDELREAFRSTDVVVG